ncbi:MAG TPA: hypothetical protein VKT52_06585 [Ktedonobacterales bacterium]|nr:hypothetical protein [Ktedonobacterales bacterium]
MVHDAAAGYAFLGLGMLHVAQGEDEVGRHLLELALERARMGLPPRLLRPVQACLAECDLFAGRPDEALGRLDSVLSSPEGREGIDATPLLPLLAWSYLEMGDTVPAEDTLREALERCRAEQHQLALLDALRVQALLAIHRERWEEAAAALDEAIALARPMPYPYAEAKALSVYGTLESVRGKHAKARERYEQALEICRRLGERQYAQRVEALLAELPLP